MPGHDKIRIVGLTDQELNDFSCGICLGIFNGPVFTQCCRQTYCKDCITKWVSINNNCPNDRKTLTARDLKPVPRVLDNLLDNMKIVCYSEDEDCCQVVTVGELSQNTSECELTPNQLCKTCGLIKESVLIHNYIQALVSKKQKIHEKCVKLSDENSTLLLNRREKDESIKGLMDELVQLKINHQREIQKIRAENRKVIQNFKQGFPKETEGMNVTQIDEFERVRSSYEQQFWINSDLRCKLSATECRLFSENKKSDEKYMNLLDENSKLFNMRDENEETINELRSELALLKIKYERDIDLIKIENNMVIQSIKQDHSRANEEMRRSHARELGRIKSDNLDLDQTNSYLRSTKWKLEEDLKWWRTSMAIVITVITICSVLLLIIVGNELVENENNINIMGSLPVSNKVLKDLYESEGVKIFGVMTLRSIFSRIQRIYSEETKSYLDQLDQKQETINKLKDELAQLKINQQKSVDKITTEIIKKLQDFKQSYQGE